MISYATIYDSVRGGMICIGVVPVEAGVIGANSNATVEVEIPGARTGDVVFLTAPINIDAGLVLAGASITDDDELSINIRNVTGAEITGDEKYWQIMILKRETPGGCDIEEEES